MSRANLSRSGQTMVEYMIIVLIIAVAAIAIFGVFGDTIREKLSGAVNELGGDKAAASQAIGTKSKEWLQQTGAEGSGN